MRELLKNYKKQIILWYVSLLLFLFSLLFLSYQLGRLLNNQKKYNTLIQNKQILTSQVQQVYFLMTEINPEKFIAIQTMPISVSIEIKNLNSLLSILSSLSSEKGSLFRINEATISSCEKKDNATLKDCLYIMNITGEKIKYISD